MRHSLTGPFCVLILLAAGMAAAEVPAFSAAPDGPSSPFDFVASGGKAARTAAAAEAPSGAKVVGGTIAADGAWPWQVALTLADQPVSANSQFCGGSMVMDQWVLTAAHCVIHKGPDDEPVALDPREISIVVGTNRLDGSGDRIDVASIYSHPSYDVNDFDYDIALIRLTRSPSVAYQTINIPDADYGDLLRRPGITTVVTGWGLQNDGTPPTDLRQAQIQMLDRDMCNQVMIESRADEAISGFSFAAGVMALSEDKAYALWDEMVAAAPVPLSENMICSGTFEGGHTSCDGDSGGPLVVPLENGSYIQAGIVSWGLSDQAGEQCAKDAKFSTYVDVSRFVPWLNEIVTTYN
ncbi:serine protease [Pseudogemmobacter faecipullorum]|uniref:Serine protease n=1 Tax=Pseudogemmobacter faecipullorum TaxID=2755041 RepID=A0ABS8CJR0_9RHOB|nr:serine protease [Pseudogemmobacter faecipullorum]MCB5409626.1 serine protease [Pseudogemmobacter faecipullorum]